MAKTPKTLQVSFGSFSCTLEGFDDPIHAMKAVTEYLRDLSARDPAFAQRLGLAPPAPESPAIPRPPEPGADVAEAPRRAEPWPEPEPQRASETRGERPAEPRPEIRPDRRAEPWPEPPTPPEPPAWVPPPPPSAWGMPFRPAPEVRPEAPAVPSAPLVPPGPSPMTPPAPATEAWKAPAVPPVPVTPPEPPPAPAASPPGLFDEPGPFVPRESEPPPAPVARPSDPPRPAALTPEPAAVDPLAPPPQEEAGAPSAPSGDTREEGAPDAAHAAPTGLRKLLAASPEGHEEEMSRFLSRADDQLADPEATRRRDVIAQLKAAVVATEAERALGEGDLGPEARQDAFRLDLSEAVRLHPPVLDGRADQGPLRLVAAQRVDAPPEAVPEAPAAPRDAPEESPEEEAVGPMRSRASFAVFATEMGATSLPDLLEAAAAWLCFVDELDSVSRAQLLALAAEVQGETPDREEGLRTFGTLLRQGRIAPVAGGRYRISEGSRFDPSRLAG